MSAGHAVLDVLARALGELRVMAATSDMPGLHEVAVRMAHDEPIVTVVLDAYTPEVLLAWCEAVRAKAGRCLAPSQMFPQWCAATASGRLGGLAVRVQGSVPTAFASELGSEWTVPRLAELVAGVCDG